MPEPHVGHAIRRARAGDAPAIVRLMRAIYLEGRYFVGDGPSLASSLARRIGGDDPAFVLYLGAEVAEVAEGGGRQLAGWLELHRMPPRRLRHVAVLTVAVAPEWRRRGLGRRLLRRCYGWARDHGVTRISLGVRAGNTAAIALYASEGFVEEGRERGQVRTDEGGFEDNVLMARRVVPG